MAKIPSPASPYFFTDLPHLSAVATESKISRNDAEKVRASTNCGRNHINSDFDLFHPLNQIHMLVRQIREQSSLPQPKAKHAKEGLSYSQKREIHSEFHARASRLLNGLLSLDTDIFHDWLADQKIAKDNASRPQAESISLLIDLLNSLTETTYSCAHKSDKELYMTTGSQKRKVGIDAAFPLLVQTYVNATGKQPAKGSETNPSPAERFLESSLNLMGFKANTEFCRELIRGVNS